MKVAKPTVDLSEDKSKIEKLIKKYNKNIWERSACMVFPSLISLRRSIRPETKKYSNYVFDQIIFKYLDKVSKKKESFNFQVLHKFVAGLGNTDLIFKGATIASIIIQDILTTDSPRLLDIRIIRNEIPNQPKLQDKSYILGSVIQFIIFYCDYAK